MFFAWLSIVYLLELALLGALAVSVIVRAVIRGRKGQVASCGRCRYPYTGSERCPECGALYATVGVHTPWLRMRLGPTLAEAAVALAVLVLFAGGFVAFTGLQAMSGLGYSTTKSSTSLTPRSVGAVPVVAGLPASITLIADVTSRSGVTVAGSVRLIVWKSPPGGFTNSFDTIEGHAYLEQDLTKETIRIFDDKGKQVSQTRGVSLHDSDIATLFKAAGFDPTTDEAKPCLTDASDYAGQVATGVSLVGIPPRMQGGQFSTTGLQPSGASRNGPSPSLPIRMFGMSAEGTWFSLVGLVSVLVYGVLLARIARHRRSLLRLADVPTSRADTTHTPTSATSSSTPGGGLSMHPPTQRPSS